MAYNKTSEERKWNYWKEQEEKKLRELGMEEEKIQKLRQMDREDFLEERRYREHLDEMMQDMDSIKQRDRGRFAQDIRELLDNIGDRRIYELLKGTEHQTLEIRLSDDTFEFLLYYIGEYWDILQKQEYLFINIKGDTTGKPMKVDSVYDMFERMEKKTGIKITPHMLRRYYANTRWESDWPLEMISQALGHKHLDTTIRYLNVLDDKLRTASQEFYRRYSNLYNVNQFLESRR